MAKTMKDAALNQCRGNKRLTLKWTVVILRNTTYLNIKVALYFVQGVYLWFILMVEPTAIHLVNRLDRLDLVMENNSRGFSPQANILTDKYYVF
jgi:hypothetical protein